MARICIVDDDIQLCGALALVIERMGHATDTALTLAEGMAKISAGGFDVVILDIRLPDGNGLDVLPALRDMPNGPEVIILSGSGDPDGAELAIRSGAWSYITKPPTLNKIQLPVQRAVEYRERTRNPTPPVALKREGIIGDSRAMLSCLDMVAQAAATDVGVLISGETGTGKELVARAIHANSCRNDKPFVVVDCAALPENLVESVLFGHEKGAFTGADRRSTGLVKQADGGTLFLDEVGEMPIDVQKSLLRVLQERRFRPVGSPREEHSDFRLVAATNRDLDAMVPLWTFRQDLLYRLRTMAIELPPLRERPGDIPLLANHFLDRTVERLHLGRKAMSPELRDALAEYDWPGNVRELMAAIESALMASGGESILYPRHLPMNIRVRLTRAALDGGGRVDEEDTEGSVVTSRSLDPAHFPSLKTFRADAMAELERQYLHDLLAAACGEIKKACNLSGLSRARLYALLKTYGVRRQEDGDVRPTARPGGV
ncbi:MAG: sigma-54-dependent transcriptional regulator [Desulfovibrionaceae bacterium]